MSYIQSIFGSFKKRGIIGTLFFLYYEIIFDYKYKLNTSKIVEIDKLDVVGPNKSFGVKYQGVNPYYFKKTLSELKIDFKESVFIDFGCGKGRALFLAAENKFKIIIGVEFANSLYKDCLANIDNYKKKFRSTEIELYNMDAVTYRIPDNANVIFFNNPFGEEVLTKVIDNINSSINENPREVFILYFSPFHDYIVQKNGFKKIYELKTGQKIESMIFTN